MSSLKTDRPIEDTIYLIKLIMSNPQWITLHFSWKNVPEKEKI